MCFIEPEQWFCHGPERTVKVIVRKGVGCVVLTTRAGEMPNVGHLARTEVTWYGIGVYYWRCVVSRGTHVIARHDDEVFDIEWNYYTHAVEVNITYWENSDNLQYG